MKQKVLFILFIFYSLLFSTVLAESKLSKSGPLCVISVMVKNEENFIVDTLEPYVNAGLKDFIILDTGSTDNTVQVAQNYFKEKSIDTAFIFQEDFIDFSSSRNRALDLIDEKFPEAEFILMPDAEWYMQNVEGLLKFCEDNLSKDPKTNPYYNLKIVSPNYSFYTGRLIRRASNSRFKGRVHELLDTYPIGNLPDNIYFKFAPSQEGLKKTKKRFIRDRDWLLLDHYQNPQDSRTVYFLAQTFLCLGDNKSAFKFYKKFTELNGTCEYTYQAYYNMANILNGKYKSKYKSRENSEDYWSKVLLLYLKAFSVRPHRVEALLDIAKHYLDKNNKQLSYIFAKRACDLKTPKNEIFIFDKNLYKFDRWDLLGQIAWYVNEFEVGEKAIKKALRFKPEAMHLHRNLEFYLNRRQSLLS